MSPHAYRPRDVQELSECLRERTAKALPVSIVGGGSRYRVGIGEVPDDALELDLSAFSGVSDYEPTELVLTAGAATPLAEIHELLAQRGQMLAFDPPDHGRLCGRDGAAATLGGTLAANGAGPRRLTAGAARDHLLGLSAVSGRGEPFKAGGRVVKNVTGFDLPKLLAGSWGTLAVLTEASVKVLPRPERSMTLLIRPASPAEAVALMARSLGTSVAPTAAAYLPNRAAERARLPGRGVVCLRIEAASDSLSVRADRLCALLAVGRGADRLEGPDEAALWEAIALVDPLAPGPLPLWRISVSASQAGLAMSGLPEEGVVVDWAGSLIWVRADSPPKLGDLRYWGGGASPHPVRAPPSSAMRLISRRLKSAFDPADILNRGRGFPPQLEALA